MENGLNIFRSPKADLPPPVPPIPPGDDDKRWTTVKYKLKIGSKVGKVDIPLMAKFSKRGSRRPLVTDNIEVIQLKDADGNIYLAAVGK